MKEKRNQCGTIFAFVRCAVRSLPGEFAGKFLILFCVSQIFFLSAASPVVLGNKNPPKSLGLRCRRNAAARFCFRRRGFPQNRCAFKHLMFSFQSSFDPGNVDIARDCNFFILNVCGISIIFVVRWIKGSSRSEFNFEHCGCLHGFLQDACFVRKLKFSSISICGSSLSLNKLVDFRISARYLFSNLLYWLWI